MLIFSFLSWWYTEGWKGFVQEFYQALKNTVDFFSITSLFKTLFSPFRQISAHGGFTDRLISKLIGLVVRIFLIIFGIIVIVLEGTIGILMSLVWPLIPVIPMACVVLMMAGVVVYV